MKNTIWIYMLFSASLFSQQSVQEPLKLVRVANSGVMLASGGTKILIDALFDKAPADYRSPDPAVLEQIMKGEKPFDCVDLVLVTHNHPDHFAAPLAVRFLEGNSSAILIAPEDAVAEMRKEVAWPKIAARVVSLDLKIGETAQCETAGVLLSACRTLHSGKAEEPMNLMYRFQFEGWSVFHEGDADATLDEYVRFGLEEAKIDLALVHYWFPLYPDMARLLQEVIRPAHIGLTHLPIRLENDAPGKIDMVRQHYHDIFLLLPGMQDKTFDRIQSPYLGQKPPGMAAEVFAPGIVSTDSNEVLIGFFDGGTVCFFERSVPGFDRDWIFIPVYITRWEKGVWTKPEAASSGGKPWYESYPDAPTGTTVFFPWKKHLDGSGPDNDIDIWKTIRAAAGWSEPQNLGSPVNTEMIDGWPSLAGDRTLYFFSTRPGGQGRSDLYRSRPNSGEYSRVENLGQSINTEYADHDPFVAPDESYLIWCSDRPGGMGANDLYISFRQSDGNWSGAMNMGDRINTACDETRPYVTGDGKYLFFNRMQSGNRDLYWVDAKIVEEMRKSL